MAKYEITVIAMCSRESFTFRADKVEDFINAIIEEAEKYDSSFTYFDAAAIFVKKEIVKILMDCADKALQELVANIVAKKNS